MIDKSHPRSVYFIKPIGMDGPVKIGCSCSPTGRRDTLQSWSPLPLEIIAEISGDFLLERRFHTAFLASHRGFEWFDISPALVTTIAAINAGTFDTDTLPPAVKRTNFRRARDNSYITPEWRYRSSFWARVRHVKGSTYPEIRKRMREIIGSDDCYGVELLPHKERLDALLSELGQRVPA
mgnify:CR=1 FL=1